MDFIGRIAHALIITVQVVANNTSAHHSKFQISNSYFGQIGSPIIIIIIIVILSLSERSTVTSPAYFFFKDMEIATTPDYLKELYKSRDACLRAYDKTKKDGLIEGVALEARAQFNDPEEDTLAVQAHNDRKAQFQGLSIAVHENLDARLIFTNHNGDDDDDDENCGGIILIRVDDPCYPSFWIEATMDHDEFFAFAAGDRGGEQPSLQVKGRIEGSRLEIGPAINPVLPEFPHLEIHRTVNTPSVPFVTRLERVSINSYLLCVSHPDLPFFWLNVNIPIEMGLQI